MTFLLLHGLTRPLHFNPGAEHIAGMLASVLVGWPIEPCTASQSPLLTISVAAEEILIERHDDGALFREPSAVSAVCTLVVEIVDALAAATPGLACLHAAAAEFSGQLVLFPATHRAGKSTLMARLSAGGRRVFADDILPFDLGSGEAVATGCLPRLRLPLPRNASPEFSDQVSRNTGISDGCYAYLAPPDEVASVRFGERRRLGAVVLLDRRKRRVAARLEPAAPDGALLEILMRNTRGDRDAALLVSTFAAIVGGIPVLRLVYFDLDDAARCLDNAFAAGFIEGHRPAASAAPVAPLVPRAPSGAAAYRRNPDLVVSRVGQAGFLADPRNNTIHVLDRVGLGVWTLLAEPRDLASLSKIVAGAFPSACKTRIAGDIEALLRTLEQRGFIDRL
jgi:hypothetical protein